jgi:hypothetical protein
MEEVIMSWSYPTGFDPNNAVTYANFCQQAYFQYYILTNTPPDFGYPSFSAIMELPPTGYQLLYHIWYDEGVFEWDPVYFGYIAGSQANPGQLVVAIRGTEDLEEWFDDIMDSSQVSCPINGSEQTLVHAGFSAIYTGLRYYRPPPGPLTPPKETDQPVELSAVLAGANSVMVAGHSLGAALGVLLTLDIALNIKCPVSSYNFGSPMVGDPTFASVFNQLLVTRAISGNFRVANGMDVVPNLPPNVFYPPESSPGPSQECDYLQVDSYCPVDSGVLSVLSDAHSLSNYVIGLRNINAVGGAGLIERPAAGLRSIPRWRAKRSS